MYVVHGISLFYPDTFLLSEANDDSDDAGSTSTLRNAIERKQQDSDP